MTSTGLTLAAWTRTRTSHGRHITGIFTALDNCSWLMSPYLCSCQADIEDGSGEGRGTVESRLQLDALLQQYVVKDAECCRTRFISSVSMHRHKPCRAITVFASTLRTAKTLIASDDYNHHILSLTTQLNELVRVSHFNELNQSTQMTQ